MMFVITDWYFNSGKMESDDSPLIKWTINECDEFIATRINELYNERPSYAVSPRTDRFLENYIDICDVQKSPPRSLSPCSPRTKDFLNDYIDESDLLKNDWSPNSDFRPISPPTYEDVFGTTLNYVTTNFSSNFRPLLPPAYNDVFGTCHSDFRPDYSDTRLNGK